MSQTEDEFIHDPVGAHGAAHEFEARIVGVVEDEVVEVEVAQTSSANASSQLISHLVFRGTPTDSTSALTVGMWFT